MSLRSLTPFFSLVLLGTACATPPGEHFLRPQDPAAAAIYRDGWIDLNKNGTKDPYEDAAQPLETRVADLLGRMTLEEKTAQMATLYGYPRVLKVELPTPEWDKELWKDGIGNIDEQSNGNLGWKSDLPNPQFDFPWPQHVRQVNEIQRWFIEHTRLGVPVDFTNEGIRGLLHAKATSFPAQLGVAAAFDPSLVREIGRVTGREARALGYSNVYSPILDLARDPRWGRTTETYGEDPFLVGEYAVEQVRGIQENQIASTLKHFAVYSIPKGGRDGEARTDPHATWRDVETIYLEPFRRAVREAKAMGVMASYNDYEGEPVESSKKFLTDILRRDWGFQGYVVSDSAAVEFIHTKHRTAATYAEAVRQSVEAGLNIRTHFTKPDVYVTPLRELARSGRLPMAVIDERVREILRVKFRLGLFDAPFRDPAAAAQVVRAPDHLALAARAARESIVLLKNDANALPLDRAKLKRVLVTGPLADNPGALWSRYGPQQLDFVTPLAGLRAKLGPSVEVRYEKGVDVKDAAFPESDLFKDGPSAAEKAGIAAAVAAAAEVDIIIAVLGESDEISRESASRVSLDLPGYQEHLLRALHATGKPVVLALITGRPLSINWAAKHVPAIVNLWFPGEEGGHALADVLCGDFNPTGRLPITFPRSAGQVPFNFPTRPGAQDRDHGQVTGPLYAFGHGLSYTKFTYSNLKITPDRAPTDATITVTCDVTNAGSRAGTDVVQLYLRDDYSSVTTWDKALRGFARVTLAPGETKPVSFTLSRRHLELYNAARQWVVEPGRFTVEVGAASDNLALRGQFTLTAADGSAPEEAPIKDAKLDPR
jgi:beta-glucosidase